VVRPLQADFVWHKLSADNMDPDFVERRRVGLENFLLRVASHPVLSEDNILQLFLTEVQPSTTTTTTDVQLNQYARKRSSAVWSA